jgi:hypothetical protein
LNLLTQGIVIQVLPNQHNLIFLRTIAPFFVIKRESLAAEVENVPLRAFVKPEDAFGAEDRGRQLIVEEVLEFLDGKGFIALDRNRGEAVYCQVIGMVMVVMVVIVVMFAVSVVVIAV